MPTISDGDKQVGKISNCDKKFPEFFSPMAKKSNEFIRGNGVLIRSLDMFDLEPLHKVFSKIGSRPRSTKLKYLPASFLHEKLASPNAIYQEKDKNKRLTVLIGTQYAPNFVVNQETNSLINDNEIVDCNSQFYPSDAGTLTRGVLEDPPLCIESATFPLCIELNATRTQCLATNTSACGPCQVPGEIVGWMLKEFLEQNKKNMKHKRMHMMHHYQCWYSDVREMIAASNSLWKFRKQWFRYSSSKMEEKQKYPGYTECPATFNIRNVSLMDAIVIPIVDSQWSNLCQPGNVSNDEFRSILLQRLQFGWEQGYSKELPVIFYRETYSPNNDSYHKEFFSQEYEFENGACLRKNSSAYADVFYFPECPSENSIRLSPSIADSRPASNTSKRSFVTENNSSMFTLVIKNGTVDLVIQEGDGRVNELAPWYYFLPGAIMCLAVSFFGGAVANKRHYRRCYQLLLVIIGIFLFCLQLLAVYFSVAYIEDRPTLDMKIDSILYHYFLQDG
mmetsp:Transcript_29442/g.44580  ORF Transcript_29442/g.44580 Transcript_29442/m.44580 type:complete len:505 (-) Transcript_29442:312-1826(-)